MADDDRRRWNEKYRAAVDREPEVSAALLSVQTWIPTEGRALDLAGGAGANAIWLARRGLDVTLADISDVGLQRAQAAAERAEVTLTTQQIDLEDGVPDGRWDVVTCTNYLQRTAWSRVRMAEGGVLVWAHPTIRNLERHAKPSARFLLAPGEGRSILASLPETEVRHATEDWLNGRHLSIVVAQRICRT